MYMNDHPSKEGGIELAACAKRRKQYTSNDTVSVNQ